MEEQYFTPNREIDCTIMEKALESIDKCRILQSINRVRMEMNVVWLSDILTADGREVDKRFLNKTMEWPLRNKHTWPIKHHTSIGDWQAWRRWIKSICRENTRSLISPLGKWMGGQEDWIAQWDCFYGNTVYPNGK
jgi:hypothetical protein